MYLEYDPDCCVTFIFVCVASMMFMGDLFSTLVCVCARVVLRLEYRIIFCHLPAFFVFSLRLLPCTGVLRPWSRLQHFFCGVSSKVES